MPPDVLVVDNIVVAADEFARLIRKATGLAVTMSTSDPEVAEQTVSSGDVRVVVLDQRMEVPGTELFARMRRHDPRLRAIMLTSEAEGPETGLGIRLGFHDYIHKTDVAEFATAS